MDYQTTCNEAMAKLAEAQKCQDEIAGCNYELQQVNNVINGTTNPQLYYQLKEQRVKLLCKIDEQTKDRDKKLNEALSKALDLADDETDKGTFNSSSLGGQAMGAISSYIVLQDIHWQSSLDVKEKTSKIIAKRVNNFIQFLNQQRLLGCLWI